MVHDLIMSWGVCNGWLLFLAALGIAWFCLILEKRINFNEFLPILQDVAKNKDKSQAGDFVEGFKVFDKEQNGHIGTAELRHLLTTLGRCAQLTDSFSAALILLLPSSSAITLRCLALLFWKARLHNSDDAKVSCNRYISVRAGVCWHEQSR